MPQMAPISWLILFIMFTIAFLMFCLMNYFSFMPPTPKSSSLTKLQTNTLTWKW